MYLHDASAVLVVFHGASVLLCFSYKSLLAFGTAVRHCLTDEAKLCTTATSHMITVRVHMHALDRPYYRYELSLQKNNIAVRKKTLVTKQLKTMQGMSIQLDETWVVE